MNPGNLSKQSSQVEEIVEMPAVNALTFTELKVCLRQGIDDFTHGTRIRLVFRRCVRVHRIIYHAVFIRVGKDLVDVSHASRFSIYWPFCCSRAL